MKDSLGFLNKVLGFFLEISKYWVGVERDRLTLWGEGTCSAFIDYPSSVCATIKMSHGVDVLLHRPALHPIFSIGLVKTEYDFIVRSADTDLGR